MTAILEREVVELDTDLDVDFDPTEETVDLDLTVDLAEMDCEELGTHRDEYVVDEDEDTVTYECQSCGESYKEDR